MARPSSAHPTDVELQILQVLWAAKTPATLGEIHAALSRRRAMAKTTVATMLGVMLAKKLVRRADSPRGYTWAAATNRKTAAAGLLGKVLNYIFDGSAQRMVAHLVDEGELSPQELESLSLLQKQRAKKRRKG